MSNSEVRRNIPRGADSRGPHFLQVPVGASLLPFTRSELNNGGPSGKSARGTAWRERESRIGAKLTCACSFLVVPVLSVVVPQLFDKLAEGRL
jgi:hypothetical protein